MKNSSSSAQRIAGGHNALSFVYPAGSDAERSQGSDLPADLWPSGGAAAARASATHEERAAEREQAARLAGYEQAQREAAARFAEQLAAERQRISSALAEFEASRESYFHKVETEVVRLALAIARKILHRETQLDPLLLSGVVRVALEKISSGTRVRLRVQPEHIQPWRNSLLQFSDSRLQVELIGDESLAADRCVLETDLGAVELGLQSQLKEIEQGLFDLLALHEKAGS